LDSVVPALMKRYDVPGAAVAVVREDSTVFLRGFGVARVSDSARVDPARTFFRLASVSKLFVATAVMQQVDAGTIRMDDDVNRYLTWRVPSTYGAPVTLERLLTHTAGFDERLVGYAAPSADSIGDLGAHLASNLPYRGWPPGAIIGYSNYGVALAAHVVERTSGLTFDRYARERIFEPLGMHRTFYLRVPDSLSKDVAAGYFCGTTCRPAPVVYSRPYPVGLSYSTATDMARFISAQLGRSPIISESALADMQRQHYAVDSLVPGMSYVWFNQTHGGYRALAHGGNVPGFNNLLLIVPEARVGFYFVTNGGRTAFGAALRDSLLAMLLSRREIARTTPSTVTESAVRSLTGNYQITRYAHRTIEAFPSLFATSTTVDAHGTRLVLPYPNGAVEFEPVDSLHFREVGGDRTIAFRRDASGRVTLLAAPIPVFGADLPATLERRAWHDGAHFMNEYVSWLLLGPMIALAAWGAVSLGVWWWRRRRGSPSRAVDGRLPAVTAWTALAFVALWLWFGFGFIARSTRMFGNGTGLVLGVSGGMRAMAAIPFAMGALATVLTVLSAMAWRRRWWDVVRRSLMSVYVVGALATIAFLIRWNYLPAVF
ncbi:MAG TPA: serine hydrolase domain-containing protein, partial [Gemmatimonadaceae bacterium]|nr:serine hydrolase domain-containing protein [Gemmatimonadaceae bacterium]